MDFLILASLLLVTALVLDRIEQRRRIALLASHLGNYQIEKMMEHLTEGYLRCLGEDDPARREQIWALLATTEQSLARQFARFAAEFAGVEERLTRVSKTSLPLGFVQRLLPGNRFDVRRVLAVHARGIADVANNTAGRSPKAKAYTMSAELFLMQHTCHWFCKSKAIASARMLARHQTRYGQLLDAVQPSTRRSYLEIVGG